MQLLPVQSIFAALQKRTSMTISYNWLSEYLPVKIDPERLSRILTSIGLEVEKMDPFEEVKGGLKGLVLGEVQEVVQHPGADKLKLTKVDVGAGAPLKIVCGAPNVAVGQKVVVATTGSTIYPTTGEPLTMKVAKIRGEESHGMICAEDEIGLGESHAGIMVLPQDAPVGTPAAQYFKPYNDVTYEIGLTPNRMDAMSHWGVARDVCAYLSHHDRQELKPAIPAANIKVENNTLNIQVRIENTVACPRYSGVCIAGVSVAESPRWLQERLKSIGLRPINNIVDITNFIQHETGQPLHAFDFDAIKGSKVVVKTLPDGTLFKTLDDKERKLGAEDLMICNAEGGMCIAGVFGGAESGVTAGTKNIFLESAFFDPISIRKTSFRHGLRTDAATRFEKGTDISATLTVLKRAAALLKEVAGGTVASDFIDIYPEPEQKRDIILKNQYLKKLSGKNYHPQAVRNILSNLGFTIQREAADAIHVAVPHHKRDVSLPADVVEEILRIDGLDNIPIPTAITITPSVEENYKIDGLKEKAAGLLTGAGFSEILTNSISNSAYFKNLGDQNMVRMLNNLSSELDVLRPSMLPTALEIIAFNHNRKNVNLRLFEWGKTYVTNAVGAYSEKEHLCIYLTGSLSGQSWKGKAVPSDIYYLKGVVESLCNNAGIKVVFDTGEGAEWEQAVTGSVGGNVIVQLGKVTGNLTQKFDVKQPVFYADMDWNVFVTTALAQKVQYKEVPRFPTVERDLAVVVLKSMDYSQLKTGIENLKLQKLKDIRLFDVFESEKLGQDKKSLAINFTFLDEDKTLTDVEIDGWMKKIMTAMEKDLGAEIRK